VKRRGKILENLKIEKNRRKNPATENENVTKCAVYEWKIKKFCIFYPITPKHECRSCQKVNMVKLCAYGNATTTDMAFLSNFLYNGVAFGRHLAINLNDRMSFPEWNSILKQKGEFDHEKHQ